MGAYCHKHHFDYDSPDVEYINIYHDNPATTPADACRTDVCIAAPTVEQLQPEEDVNIIRFMVVVFWFIAIRDRMRNWQK